MKKLLLKTELWSPEKNLGKILAEERLIYQRWGVVEHVECHSCVSAADLVLGIFAGHFGRSR